MLNSKVLDISYKTVIKESLKRFSETGLVQILTAGGFARNEGAFYDEGGLKVPINDLDIYLVFKDKKPSEEEIRKAAKAMTGKIRQRLGLSKKRKEKTSFFSFKDDFFVDLHAVKIKELSRPLPLIRFWEMTKNHQPIWGVKKNLMKSIKQSEIPYSEGVRFLANQLTIPLRFCLQPEPTVEALYFLNRTWTSYATTLLLLKRKLEPNYLDRAKVLKQNYQKWYPKLAEQLPDLANQVYRASKFKLKPDFSNLKQLDKLNKQTIKAGVVVYDYFLESWLKGESRKDNLAKLKIAYYQGYLKSPLLAWLANIYLGLTGNQSLVSTDISLFRQLPRLLEKGLNNKKDIVSYLALFEKAKKVRERF
ncbi:hypothetical protein ACFL18_02020 [Patescibacteria group bacterium]